MKNLSLPALFHRLLLFTLLLLSYSVFANPSPEKTGHEAWHRYAVADYTITTTATTIVITDISGNGETLTVSQSSSNIRFVVTPTTRTYSINGGAITVFTTPADIALAGANSITMNTAAGNDIINIGAFTASLPSLTINGGTGDDAMNFNGDINFATNANLNADLQNDDATPGIDALTIASSANVKLFGTGTATVKVSKNVTVNAGGSLETANGSLVVEANQQATPTAGTFTGVSVAGVGSLLKSTGRGVTVKGKGGGSQQGVFVSNGGQIRATASVTVVGNGAGGGVAVTGTNSLITSETFDVSVTGTSSGSGDGVSVSGAGQITAGGDGTVTVIGNGGVSSVYVTGANSLISSESGDLNVTGKDGSTGIEISEAGSIRTRLGGNLSLIANSILLTPSATTLGSVSTPAGFSITLRPFTAGTPIILGQTGSIGTFSFSDAQLDRMTTGTLIIGNANAGTITLLAPISRPAATNVQLISAGDVILSGGGINTNGGTLLLDPGASPAAVKPTFNGTDVTASALSFGGNLELAIIGTTPGTQYQQLNVVGTVNLTGVDLLFAGAYTPIGGEIFTIVDNDGSDAIMGTFTGLAQGATLSNFLGSGLNAIISYTGGTGNDVVLTVVGACPDLTAQAPAVQVTNSTCATFGGTPSGGVISAPAGTCPAGSTLQYSTDNGGTWVTTLPIYAQTGPAQTILTRCNCNANTATSSPTASVTTVPGTCPTCPVLTAAAPAVQVTNSTCATFGGTPSGGIILAPSGTCPAGSTLQYSTDNGGTWVTTLPIYAQTGPAQTILTRCNCNANTASSPTASVTTMPGTCPTCPVLTAAAPAVQVTNSTCATFGGTPSGGIISAPSGTCPAGSTLQYSTDNGGTWVTTLPIYAQTGPAQTILTRCNCNANTATSSPTASVTTVPGTCPNCPVLTAQAPVAQVTNSTCATFGGTPSGGVISAPTGTCPAGSTLQYSTDNGGTWVTTLPIYAQTGPAQTILTRCNCNANTATSSPTASVTTVPGTCPTCPVLTAAAPAVQVTNSTCVTFGGTPSGGVISAPTGTCPAGSTLQYSTDNGGTWVTTLPIYAQTGPAQTILTRCNCNANTATSSPTASVTTVPGTCPNCPVLTAQAPVAQVTNSTCATFGGTPSGGVISAPTGTCPAGSTLQYSTDNGGTWVTTLPIYAQTGPAQTILTRCNCNANTATSSPTASVTTMPGTCPTCPVLTAAAPAVQVTNSTCATFGGTPSGGVISAPTGTCPAGSTLQYSTNNGMNWSTTLPTYTQGTTQTILTRCNCNANTATSSPTASVATVPGTCPTCPVLTAAAPAVQVNNSTCATFGGTPSGGVISAPTGTCPAGSTLQYSTDNGGTWVTTLPIYAQTGPAQTILTRCNCNANTATSSPTASVTTVPGTCPTCPVLTAQAPAVRVTNSTCSTGCILAGGTIAAPSGSCPSGSTIQYKVGNNVWSSTLPTYNQTTAQTIETRCSCDANPTVVSNISAVTTVPGTCPISTASIVLNNGPICSGQNAVFTVTGTNGATLTYTLTGQAGNQTLLLNGSNQTLTANNVTANATLTLLSVTKDNCSVTLTATSSVVINTLSISNNISIGTSTFTGGTITATNQISNANVTYIAGNSVTLLPGFKAEGTVFTAQIGSGCPQN